MQLTDKNGPALSGSQGLIVDSVFKFNSHIPAATKLRRESHDVQMKHFDKLRADHDVRSHCPITKKGDRKFSVASAEVHNDLSTEDGSPFRGLEEMNPTQIMLERWTKANALSIPTID